MKYLIIAGVVLIVLIASLLANKKIRNKVIDRAKLIGRSEGTDEVRDLKIKNSKKVIEKNKKVIEKNKKVIEKNKKVIDEAKKLVKKNKEVIDEANSNN